MSISGRDPSVARLPLRKAWSRVVELLTIQAPALAGQGLRQLAAYRLRTALALSGIIVGVAALVASLALLDGSERMVIDMFERMGGTRAGRIMVKTGSYQFGRWTPFQKYPRISAEDSAALRAGFPEIEELCLGHTSFGTTAESQRTKLTGIFAWGLEPNHLEIRPMTILAGRNFDANDIAAAAPVALLMESLALELYGRVDVIGEEVRINGERFTVIGVIRWLAGRNRKWIYIPLSAMHERINRDETCFLWYRLRAGHAMDAALREELTRFLVARHPGSKAAEFDVVSWGERRDGELREIRTQGRVLISVAVLCLLAGGVGIMNIFLISATERTREIGLRIALGATRRSVLGQFLFEAALLCAIGGAIGILLATGLAQGFAAIVRERMAAGGGQQQTLAVAIGARGIAIGFGLSIGTAMVFGLFPAWRASRFDPVKCLHSE